MSNNSALYVYPYICFWSKLFNKKVVFRKFGGNYDKTYNNCSGLKKKIIDYALKHSDLLLFESFYLVDFFKNRYPEVSVIRFPNCRIKGSVRTLETYNRKFVYIGSIKKEKGLREILACSHQLDDSYTLDIYGPLDGNISVRDFQQTNVSYKGLLKADQVQDTLALYDVLLLPTYYDGEGYPGIIIEAFSIDMPVITTRWNAIPEIVTDRYNGLVIPIKDEKALLKAIKEMDGMKTYRLILTRISTRTLSTLLFLSVSCLVKVELPIYTEYEFTPLLSYTETSQNQTNLFSDKTSFM